MREAFLGKEERWQLSGLSFGPGLRPNSIVDDTLKVLFEEQEREGGECLDNTCTKAKVRVRKFIHSLNYRGIKTESLMLFSFHMKTKDNKFHLYSREKGSFSLTGLHDIKMKTLKHVAQGNLSSPQQPYSDGKK